MRTIVMTTMPMMTAVKRGKMMVAINRGMMVNATILIMSTSNIYSRMMPVSKKMTTLPRNTTSWIVCGIGLLRFQQLMTKIDVLSKALY